MKVLFNPFVSNQRVVSGVSKANQTNQNSNPFMSFGNLQGPSHDVFEKTTNQTSPIKPLQIYAAPAFTARGPNGNTAEGWCLKRLRNITDPYGGEKMMNSDVLNYVEKKLYDCKNISERVKLLAPYEKNMLKREKTMYNIFKGYAKKHPEGSMQDCLGELRVNSLAKLQKDEFKVLTDIDNMAAQGGTETAKRVKKITKDARKIIKENKREKTFKRGTFLDILGRTVRGNADQEFSKNIMATARKLPQSKTDVDAFVIKYADRGSHEIAARLVRPSLQSIEHITPASTEGDATLANFMLVSTDLNSARGNIPFPQWIKSHPKVPQWTQEYTNDIINSIQHKELKNRDWYPYVLKEKLYNESEGMIDVDISKHRVSKERAFEHAPQNIKDIYNDLMIKNTARRNGEVIPETAAAETAKAAEAAPSAEAAKPNSVAADSEKEAA